MNSFQFTGRLATMPELSKTDNGKSVCRFRLAVKRTYKSQDQYVTDFFNVVTRGAPAEFAGRYLCKGQLIGVSGSAQTRKYEKKPGETVTVVEFIADKVENLTPKAQNETKSEQGNGSDISSHINDSEHEDYCSMLDDNLPF